MLRTNVIATFILCAALSPGAMAQDKDRDHGHERLSKLEAGTIIPVRMSETIAVERSDISAAVVLASRIDRVYRGTIDQDVRAENGRLAIPKGSSVEVMVRVAHDNGLRLDLESVVVNNERYAVQAEPKGDYLVSEIIGDQTAAEVSGSAINAPLNSIVMFRLKRSLDIGVADPGFDRDGVHYHGGKDR